MANKHYRVGYSLERDVKKALEAKGWVVYRSAGSHSMADLIALKQGPKNQGRGLCEVSLIQCKRHRNLMTNRELVEFNTASERLNADAVIAWRDKGIHLEYLQ